MALIKTTLEAELLNIFTAVEGKEVTPESSARDLATAIDNYIKTALVQVDVPIPVVTPTGPGSISTPVTGRLM